MKIDLNKLRELAEAAISHTDDYNKEWVSLEEVDFRMATPPETILALLKVIEIQKEALEFYADVSIYDHIHTARIGVNGECGEKARQALAQVEEILNG